MSNTSYGVLVGWTCEFVGGRIMLRLDSVVSRETTEVEDADQHHLLMTENQALLLGNYLIQRSGKSPPQAKRSWLRRAIGR